jgi:hypothetical protein
MQGMGIPSDQELLLMSKGWKNGSTSRWRKLRQQVLDRDGHVCQYCGSEENLHIDHIIPKRLIGEQGDTLDNLITACRSCNLSKGGKVAELGESSSNQSKGGFFGKHRTPPTLHGVYIPQNGSVSHD